MRRPRCSSRWCGCGSVLPPRLPASFGDVASGSGLQHHTPRAEGSGGRVDVNYGGLIDRESIGNCMILLWCRDSAPTG